MSEHAIKLQLEQARRERDEARQALRDLVDSTDWIPNIGCVIRQSAFVGSGGALDRAMILIGRWFGA